MNEEVTITLTRYEASELNYHILKKLDYDCYSESSKKLYEGIHKKLIRAIND